MRTLLTTKRFPETSETDLGGCLAAWSMTNPSHLSTLDNNGLRFYYLFTFSYHHPWGRTHRSRERCARIVPGEETDVIPRQGRTPRSRASAPFGEKRGRTALMGDRGIEKDGARGGGGRAREAFRTLGGEAFPYPVADRGKLESRTGDVCEQSLRSWLLAE